MSVPTQVTVPTQELIKILELASLSNGLTMDSLNSTRPTEDSTEDERDEWEQAVMRHNRDNLTVMLWQRQLGVSPLENNEYHY